MSGPNYRAAAIAALEMVGRTDGADPEQAISVIVGCLKGAAHIAAERMRERAAARVKALAEDHSGDLGDTWDGGWEAACEEADRAIRALPVEPSEDGAP